MAIYRENSSEQIKTAKISYGGIQSQEVKQGTA
jgi:hypothetical protein